MEKTDGSAQGRNEKTKGDPRRAALPPLSDPAPLQTGVMGPYQDSDRQIIDYAQYMVAGNAFRGPAPANPRTRAKLGFIGAAQTFGRFARLPFPDILGSLFNLDVLNLGYAGAGASFFTKRPALLTLLSNSRAVVVQVMSGRSVANSVFDSPGGRNVLIRRSDGERMTDAPAYRWVLETMSKDAAMALVRETQDRWIEEMIGLSRAIKAPKVLFWFSTRALDFTPEPRNFNTFMGEFPHLVSREMIEAVRPHYDDFVECRSARGLPQPLVDRSTRQPVRVNFAGAERGVNVYYPSPQMHLDAAVVLEGPLRKIIGEGSAT